MNTDVLIRCHCGQFSERAELRDDIPVKGELCHCNICRHVTGALTFSSLELTSAPVDAFQRKLVKYATSEKITRYFCQICGTHVGYYAVARDGWNVCSGAVDVVLSSKTAQLERYSAHEYVGDTIDGGLAACIPGIPIYVEDDSGTPTRDVRTMVVQSGQPDGTNIKPIEVNAECHCGRTHVTIKPPDDGSKWTAGICACRSCRLSSGQPLTPWLFNIPYDKVIWHDGDTYEDGIRQSLQRFYSSDHAHRDFCSNCGASVFYNTMRQPGVMDIAFGLLRAKDGALARSLVEWDTTKIHHEEDAIDKGLITIMKDNLAALQSA